MELQWVNPTMKMPLPQPLTTALTYLGALLTSTDHMHWAELKRKINTSPLWDLPIAPRWWNMLKDDWSLLPNTPSPLALDKATLVYSLTSAALNQARAPMADTAEEQPKVVLHLPTLRQKGRKNGKTTSNVKCTKRGNPSEAITPTGPTPALALCLKNSPHNTSNTAQNSHVWRNS